MHKSRSLKLPKKLNSTLFFLVLTLVLTTSFAQESIVFLGKTTTLNSSTITGNTSLTLGDVIRITDVADKNGQSLDALLTVSSVGSGANYDPSNAKLELVPYDASSDDFLGIGIEFVETGTSSAVSLTKFKFQVTDIDSESGFDFAEVVGFSNANSVDLGANLQSGGFENGGSPGVGINTYRIRPDILGSASDWSDEVNGADTDEDYFATANYSLFSSTEFIFGATGTNGSSAFARGVLLDGMSFQTDSDGDNVADEDDLDDDNDGILDSDEVLSCSPTNLALSGTATMSSTYSGSSATYAINNSLAELAHTNAAGSNDWINIDLGSDQTIGSIIINNRTDCCSERLDNVYVMVSSTAFPTSDTDVSGSLTNAEFIYQIGSSSGLTTFTIPVNVDARYIQLQKSGNNNGSDYINILELQVLAPCDSDSDGTPNYLDLDSDGDGCSDALEVGATTDETFDYKFPDVDTNDDGLVDAVDDGSNSGTANDGIPDYTASLAQVIDAVANCDCPYGTGTDSDQDGIDDYCDPDNDNDGILDTDECIYNVRNCMDWDGTNDYNARSGTIVDALTNNLVTISFSATLWNFDFYSTPSGASSINGKAGIDGFCDEFTGVIGNNGDVITFSFSAPVSNPGIQISSMGASGNTATHTVLADGKPVPLILNTLHSATSDPSPTITGNTISGSEAVLEYVIPGVYSTIELIVSTVSADAYMFSLVSLACDYDLDGIANDIDLDSDNDGCSDALEVGATTDETANYKFPDVDTNNDGLVDAVDDGSNSGTANDGSPDYTATLAQVLDGTASCDCPNGTGIDTDNDGIDNACDIDDDNDGIPDAIEGCSASGTIIINGDFEANTIGLNTYSLISGTLVPGWRTSATDNQIEIWGSGHESVPSQNGDYFAELNANQPSTLYDEISAPAGSIINWSIWHRGRSGTDVANVLFGADTSSLVSHTTMTTGNTAWQNYTGSYTVPAGQHSTILALQAVSAAGGISVGNFIDNIEITITTLGTCRDSDNDGIPDSQDLDSDNDGILDIVEYGGTDSNGDGVADSNTDTDGDGLVDILDNDDTDGPAVSSCTHGLNCDFFASTSLLLDLDADGTNDNDEDADADGYADYIDIDSDNDGIVDNIEAQSTSGYTAPSNTDTDNDGIDDAYDTDCTPCGGVTGTAISPVDSESDGIKDYVDSDSDNDAIADAIEGHDTNGDGVVNGTDAPNANTGLAGGSTDADGDGLLDGFDNNTANSDPTNGSLTAESHPDVMPGGTAEQDWRESPDTDQDGVPDATDLDDDNDGILDADEQGCTSGQYFIGWWHNNPYADVKQDGYAINPGGAAPTFWATGAAGADTSIVTGQGTDETIGSGMTSTFHGSLHTLYSADQSTFAGAITDNDYIEYGFTTTDKFKGTLDKLGFAKGDNSSSEPRTASHTLSMIISDDNFTTADTLLKDYSPEAPTTWYQYEEIDILANNYQLKTGTTYKFRIYVYGLPAANADTMNIDDYQLSAIACPDSDNDGIADYHDIDSDNDGIVDNIEAQATSSYVAPSNSDTDNDGVDDAYDTDCTPCGGVTGVSIAPVDTDSDGTNDFLDADSDNDDLKDAIEGHDTNGDGVVNGSDSPNANTGLPGGTTDADGDGLLDGFDNNTASPDPTNGSLTAESHPDVKGGTAEQDWREGIDTDRDGIIDTEDLDDDNDGIPDSNECGGTASNWSIPTTLTSSMNLTDVGQITTGSQTANISVSSTNALTADASTELASFNENVNQTITLTSDAPLMDVALFFQHIYLSGTDTTFIGDFQVELWNGTVLNNVAFGSVSGSNGFPLIPNSTETPLSITTKGGVEYAYDDTNNGAPDQHYGMLEFTSAQLKSGVKKIIFTVLGGPSGNSGLGITARVVPDTDQDGIIDCLDLDSDSDGIPDLIEVGGVDSDGDGRVDDATDSDGDGLANTFETADGSTSILLDTDGDGTTDQDGDIDNDGLPNWVDLDADGDGILDITEVGGTDSNRDGIADNNTDADGDGLFDVYDPDASDGPSGTGTNGSALITVSTDGSDANSRPDHFSGIGIADSDGDDVPNYLDVDSDNDGILDIYESQATTGYIPPSGSDDDGDGIDNAFDDDDVNYGGAGAAGTIPVNTDSGTGDTKADYLDSDSDDDGVPDMQEAWDSLDDGDSQPDGVSGSCTTDTDGDGLVDCFDSNDADKSVWTISDTPPADDGTGGATASTGVDITASNEVDTIFPNNANGDSATEPDWRDIGNAECASAATIYAISDTGTAYEWNSSTQKHQSGFSSGIVRATNFCIVSGGWYRFYNPLEPTNYLFAIQNGTNTTELGSVIDYIEIEVQASPITTNSADHGFTVMARSWKVVTKGDLNGTVNIRFYFTPSEYSSFTTAADNMTNSFAGGVLETAWFKINSGLNYSSVPSDPDDYSLDNYTDLNSLVSGQSTGQVDSDFGGNSKNHVQFNGLSSFSGGTFGGTTGGTLPVEWLSFDVSREGDDAKLSWETARESNNDKFEIERSIDKRIFTPIGEVKAVGSSSEVSSYDFLDPNLRDAQSPVINYRLKQIDFDGSFSYSKTVEIQLINTEDLSLLIYPNPADQFIFIRYNSSGLMEQEKEIRVYDVLSHELYKRTLPAGSGAGEFNIPVDTWRKGYYYISISTEKQTKVYKVVVE